MASPFGQDAESEAKPGSADGAEMEEGSGASVLGQVLLQCWPVVGAIFFSGTFFVLAFPFFPYVPSDGTFGQDLPRVGHDTSHSL